MIRKDLIKLFRLLQSGASEAGACFVLPPPEEVYSNCGLIVTDDVRISLNGLVCLVQVH